jgi:hypothetical protein
MWDHLRNNHKTNGHDPPHDCGEHIATQPYFFPIVARVVLSDVLGGKDVVEGRDGRTDGRTCRIVIGRIRVKTELHPQIRFYILPLVNTVG